MPITITKKGLIFFGEVIGNLKIAEIRQKIIDPNIQGKGIFKK